VNTNELLFLAARARVTFWLDGDRLAYRAPKGSMTDEIRQEIKIHAADLIAILQRDRLDAAPPISRTSLSESDGGPLASGQERLWLIDHRNGASPLQNVHIRLRWKGLLDREFLTLSIRDIVARHAALRTTFPEIDGAPRAVVSPDAVIEIAQLDLRDRSPKERAGAVDSLILAHQRTPFDLERGPLTRIDVIILADDDHIVLVTQHHIITDGWSMRIFLTELGQGYRARCLGQHAQTTEPRLRYSDYASWQHEWRKGKPYQERLAWWKEHLAGLSPLEFPRDYLVQSGMPDYHGAAYEFTVPVMSALRLKDLAREQHCTLYTVLLTAWAILLHRYAGQNDFAIGTVTSGRDRMELQDLVGFFANTLVLRCDLSGDPSVVEAIARLRAETESAFQHEVEFADVVMVTGAAQDASLTPLIQAAFLFESIPAPEVLNPENEPRIPVTAVLDAPIDAAAEGTTKFDLSLFMRESDDGISCCLKYAKAQFDASAIQRLGEHFLILLQSIVQNPDETAGALEVLSEQERRQLLVEWNDAASSR
jgi:Condensation domain/TubC N-terminal docking domain